MDLLEGLEFEEKGVQSADVFEGGGADVEDGGEGETEEEEIDSATGESARLEVWQTGDVGASEMDCIEPVDAALVTGEC